MNPTSTTARLPLLCFLRCLLFHSGGRLFGTKPFRVLCVLLFNLSLPSVALAAQFTSPTDPTCGLRYLNGRADPGSDTVFISGRHEYDVKAALLYRCLELVQWPTTTSASSSSSSSSGPLVIGILGKNPFGDSLNSFSRKVLAGRPLQVTKISSVTEATSCSLVYVSSSEKKRAAKILKQLDGLPILTVGEAPGFVEAGGMINFVLEGKNMRLELNRPAAEKVGLTIDPQLVKLAGPATPSG